MNGEGERIDDRFAGVDGYEGGDDRFAGVDGYEGETTASRALIDMWGIE